jgi:PAS domain-containing protein
VTGKDGTRYGRIWTFHDSPLRKQTEKALKESEECFADAFEHAPIGMALVSTEGRWLKVNRALCKLVGYSEAELLSRNFQEITCPEDLSIDLKPGLCSRVSQRSDEGVDFVEDGVHPGAFLAWQ